MDLFMQKVHSNHSRPHTVSHIDRNPVGANSIWVNWRAVLGALLFYILLCSLLRLSYWYVLMPSVLFKLNFFLLFLNTDPFVRAQHHWQPLIFFLLSVFVAGRASGLGCGRGKKRSGAAGEGQGNSLAVSPILHQTGCSQWHSCITERQTWALGIGGTALKWVTVVLLVISLCQALGLEDSDEGFISFFKLSFSRIYFSS